MPARYAISCYVCMCVSEHVLLYCKINVIVTGLDHVPTDYEILSAVCKLKNKAPCDSDLTPRVWKTLVTDELTFSILRESIKNLITYP